MPSMMTASIGSGRVISRTGQVRTFPIVGSALVTVARGRIDILKAAMGVM